MWVKSYRTLCGFSYFKGNIRKECSERRNANPGTKDSGLISKQEKIKWDPPISFSKTKAKSRKHTLQELF